MYMLVYLYLVIRLWFIQFPVYNLFLVVHKVCISNYCFVFLIWHKYWKFNRRRRRRRKNHLLYLFKKIIPKNVYIQIIILLLRTRNTKETCYKWKNKIKFFIDFKLKTFAESRFERRFFHFNINEIYIMYILV